MKKYITILAVALFAMFTTAQTNQYFWYNGNLMMGNPIAQIDSVTFGEGGPTDTLHILLPRTIIKEVHDTVEVAVHDTVYITNYTCLPEGALPGEFSVSPSKKVRFSKGNLQYNAALGTHQCADGTTQQGTWRFAENQWDYVGNAATYGTVYENGVKCNNALISSTYNGWIDLFGWGTSGWNSGANAYQPWNTSTSYTDYYAGGSYSNSIVGIYANADWGIYNAITNGGNKANKWRTMTHDEWCWVLNSRPNAYNLRGQATVNNVHGYILLPDNFEVPAEISFIACPDNWTSNVYSPEQWAQLDSMGAIFLPTTGYREGTNLDRFTAMCDYWSSTSDDEDSSKYVTFAGTFVKTHTWDYRYRGRGVRLVQDVE